MLILALRDLQWRRRRFAVGVVGTAMVFALTLILGAIATSFDGEANRTIAALNADEFVVPVAANGPFTGISLVPATLRVEAPRTSPLVIGMQPIKTTKLIDTAIFGFAAGGLGEPRVSSGRLPINRNEAVIDEFSGLEIGNSFQLSDATFRVVGLTRDLSMNLGNADLFLRIEDVQRIVFRGQTFATTIAVSGHATSVPEGFKVMTAEQAKEDLKRPVRRAMAAISPSSFLLWIIAATIIGSIVYTSSIERTRDFAVMEATGTSNKSLLGSVALQSVILSLSSGVLGAAGALILVPFFPLPLRLETDQYAMLAVVAVVVGLVASVASVRRAIKVEPAMAFGGP